MSQNNYLSRNKLIGILLVCLISLSVIAMAFVENVKDLLVNQTTVMLEEMANQGAQSIKETLEKEFRLLEVLIADLSDVDESSSEQINQRLKWFSAMLNAVDERRLRAVGVVKPEGEFYLSTEESRNIIDPEVFETVFKGEETNSQLLSVPTEEGLLVVYIIPIVKESEVIGVVTAAYDASYLIEKMKVDFFEGQGIVYVLDDNWELQFYTGASVQTLTEEHDVWHQMTQAPHLEGAKNTTICKEYIETISGSYYTMTEIESPNWKIVYTIPDDLVGAGSEEIIHILGETAICLILLFTSILAYTIIMGEIAKRKIYKLAYISTQTNLYNQNKFIEETQKRLGKSEISHTLLIFDVNSLAVYKEILGTEFGEALIRVMGGELERLLDGQDILYAHIGVDRFAILLPFKSEKQVMQMVTLLEKNMEAIEVPDYPNMHIMLSIGIYYLPQGSTDIYKAINKADLARQRVKGYHDKSHQVFKEKDAEVIKQVSGIESGILRALDEKQFVVYYQPKLNVATGQIAGAEALVRWQHPEKGMISPGKFIPIAEANGSILEISKYVIKQVCEDIWRWQKQGMPRVPISINLSEIELYSPDMLHYMKQCLKRYHVEPRYIELEITERIAIADLSKAKAMINSFKNLGFKVSMDDFGAGYSGAGYIKYLPFDTIKIDKMLIDDIDMDHKSKQILLGMVQVIKSLGLDIVAEGVENQKQADCIKEMGVDYIQGYVFARPMDRKAFETLLIK